MNMNDYYSWSGIAFPKFGFSRTLRVPEDWNAEVLKAAPAICGRNMMPQHHNPEQMMWQGVKIEMVQELLGYKSQVTPSFSFDLRGVGVANQTFSSKEMLI